MAWQRRFDRLLKAMSQGEPHKAEKRSQQQSEEAKRNADTKAEDNS
jgi:hypothetical protein